MAPTITAQELINRSIGQTFTFEQAITFMKVVDQFPTQINSEIKWVNAKTGQPVIIGYIK